MGWRRGYNKNQTCKHDITIEEVQYENYAVT